MAYVSRTVEVEGRALGESLEVSVCTLEVMAGSDLGARLRFDKPIVRIGSDPLCDLVLTDQTVSRQHCEVSVRDATFKLSDLGSTNGTFLNELKVGDVYLKDGTVFRVGNTRVQFRVETERQPLTRTRTRYGDIIGVSPGIRDVFAVLDKVSPSELSVLIEGETGTGKELIARAIHQHSGRKARVFEVFDCSSFPGTLLESELFGHEKGSFSGAHAAHRGVFERANGGTVFFDELGEMDIGPQAKFLRALETGEFRRVGGERTIRVDVRVVAATNQSLDRLMEEGLFRRDLFYRLAKVRIRLPALRERRLDIPLLAEFFLGELSASTMRRPHLADDAIDALIGHSWPGNIRELRNVIERVAIMGGDVITGEYLTRELGTSGGPVLPPQAGASDSGSHALIKGPSGAFIPLRQAKDQLISDFERQYLVELLDKHDQNVSAASREAQVDRRHFYRLLKKYDLMKE